MKAHLLNEKKNENAKHDEKMTEEGNPEEMAVRDF